jgi:exodeoxyribonuclease VII large subunit
MPVLNPPVTGQLALTFQPEKRIFRVSDLNAELQRVLESDFRGIFVAGEISSCRMASSGHYYFSLKDEKSQVKAVLFKGSARYLKFKPQDGLAVIARGNLEVYEARGEYQLVVESLEPQGAGALQLAFDQLKAKLAGEGLFDAGRKRPLPKFPSRIGVITSPSGAYATSCTFSSADFPACRSGCFRRKCKATAPRRRSATAWRISAAPAGQRL